MLISNIVINMVLVDICKEGLFYDFFLVIGMFVVGEIILC